MGLQQRIPGKTFQQILTGPITAINVFYNVRGRNYKIIDYGQQEIIEVDTPPIVIPPLPSKFTEWFDDFSGYAPDGLIARIWGAGYGNPNVGVVETYIRGFLDPWDLFGIIPPPGPIPPPPPGGEGGQAPGDGGGNVPPTPPPDDYSPGDCADLPDTDYQVLSLGAIFTSVHQWISPSNLVTGSNGGNVHTFIAFPPYGTPYVDQGPQPMAGSRARFRDSSSSTATNASTSETLVQAEFDLSSRDDPPGTTYWLVGTKTKSTGVLGAFNIPVQASSCAAVQFALEGETFGNLELIAEEGILAVTTPPSVLYNVEANGGTFSYTHVRVYAPET